MRVARSLVGVLLGCLAWALIALETSGEEPEEPRKLNDLIEKSVHWYDVFPSADSTTPLTPQPVKRWRNVVRGQKGDAMMVIWAHKGRPVAMAGIYPWEGKMSHEFDSLSRQDKLVARDKGNIIWSPASAGVNFKDVPGAPKPAKTPAERLRQMKAIAERFKATLTGWQGDNADREELRLHPRQLYRYDLANVKEPEPDLLDGGLFAYVQGTDPEVVLVLEAIGTAEKAGWQYALVRASSGGLEVKLGNELVWSVKKYPEHRNPVLPHFTMRRDLEE